MMQGLWENVIQCGFKYYQTEDSAPAWNDAFQPHEQPTNPKTSRDTDSSKNKCTVLKTMY